MPIINRVADLADEITTWRRDFHENPELLFDVHRTAGIVTEKLKSFGHKNAVYAPNFDMIESYIIANAAPGDAVVVMGAGSVTKLSDTLSQRFSRTA